MSTISLPIHRENTGRIRRVNAFRDLPKIADLVELCFHKNMDGDGQRYIQQMRDASKNRKYLQWANNSLPVLGYIWEDNGQIVGNISIVPFAKRNFLLANVAVHPAYRRRGIARKLTERSMQYVRERAAKSIWLHVEDDNQAAIQLYEPLGFVGKALRSTWFSSSDLRSQTEVLTENISTKVGRFRKQNLRWLAQNYPEDLRWYRMPDFQIFSPGIKYWLYRIFVEYDIRQWAIQKEGRIQALVNWVPAHKRRTPLWLATTPQADAQAVTNLLLHARSQLFPKNSKLYIDYPAGQHGEALTKAGFTLQRTLLWMRAPRKV